eukprot:gene416-1081_t
MFVITRSGKQEPVSFDKIMNRITSLCYGLDTNFVHPVEVTQKVIEGMHNQVTTTELDLLSAETCAYMSQKHPDYSKLAARIAVSNLHKNSPDKFSEAIELCHNYHDKQGRPASLIAEDVYDFVMKNAEALDEMVDCQRDFDYDYFGFKTLERGSYLLKVDGKIVERPAYMLMRVSVGIHCGNLDLIKETYDLLSQRYFTHATPTLFNAGTPQPQMSSCFLLTMQKDSITGIYDTLKQCALISRTAGGIGLSVSNIRAAGSYIRGSNGYSNGLVPMLRVFNETARYVDQGGGKRKGSFAIYLEPWHADVFDLLEHFKEEYLILKAQLEAEQRQRDERLKAMERQKLEQHESIGSQEDPKSKISKSYDWLDLRKNHGKEEQRARDLFYALWIPDLFMQRVKENGEWSLFCPNEAPGLQEVWGDEFNALYKKYEEEGRARKSVKAQQLWFKILESQVETGTPYMLYKDACNRKSNQQNLGTIKSSNLCTEIIEYSAPDEIAVCNLASVALNMFVKEDGTYDHAELCRIIKVMTRNLNKVIDLNFYPCEETRNSNMRHRPIGIGVQGLADAFLKMKIPYESPEARQLNKDIFETIYYGACEASMELAVTDGTYESWGKNGGCPASKGVLQFDMWGVTPDSGRWDWDALKEKIKTVGMRNSLLMAPMPTASTAQILGNNESFEPYTQNLYVRRTLSGEFVQINRHLTSDLINLGLWNDQMKNDLIKNNGSVQAIMSIPEDLRELYKTCWEIKQKAVLDMAADRGAYIDQSQSLNIHMTDVNTAKLSSMHFHGWQKGLKTGMYYLRTKAAADAIKFTVEGEKAGAKVEEGMKNLTVKEKAAALQEQEDQENDG